MPDHDDLTCQALVELVTDYLDEALPSTVRWRLERHLAACPGCQSYLDQIRLTILATGQTSRRDLPVEVTPELLQLFRIWKSERPPRGV